MKLVELRAIGWSYNAIHERYPYILVGTIKTTIARSRQRGPTQETLARSNPPKKLDEEDKAMLLRAIEENPRIKYDGLLALINSKSNDRRFGDFFERKISENGSFFNDQSSLRSKPEYVAPRPSESETMTLINGEGFSGPMNQ